jgi:alpha-beta hydrolase superfamily lysophospholipase
MQETTSWLDCDDGTRLFLRRWKAEAETPVAAILIVHGMSEHSLRYRRFAEKLCARGFEVWAGDMRGHGQTADLKVNKKNKGGLRGHTADKNGFFRVVADIRIIMRHIAKQTKKDYKGETPLFLMGHSWGSFLAQAYIEKPAPDVNIKGCILSGTRGPGGAKIAMGARFLAVAALFNGSRRNSRLVELISVLPYNKPFRPTRTPFDWLSRDDAEVDAYIADPFSAHRCSAGFYRDMISGLSAIHRKGAIAKIDTKLPVYLFSGSADPVGDMGSSPTKLVNAYSGHGIRDIEFVLYPEARHETINETNRDEVTENIINWLMRRVK